MNGFPIFNPDDCPITPADIDMSGFLYEAFGNVDDEVVACEIVLFCQQKGGWTGFTRQEVADFLGQQPDFGGLQPDFSNLLRKRVIVEQDGRYFVTTDFAIACYKSRPRPPSQFRVVEIMDEKGMRLARIGEIGLGDLALGADVLKHTAHNPDVLRERMKDTAGQFFLVKWTGTNNPSGVRIARYVVSGIHDGMVDAVTKDNVGTYTWFVENGGEKQNNQVMLIHLYPE